MMNSYIVKNRQMLAAIVLLFILAFGIRIFYQKKSIVRNQIISDARSYYLGAFNLHKFGVYSSSVAKGMNQPPEPEAFRTPGYSLFLVPFFSFADNQEAYLKIVFIAQAVLGALTTVIIFLLTRYFTSFLWAILAATLTALSPHLIAMDFFLLTESPFTFFLALAMLTLCLAWHKENLWLPMLAGCLMGAVMLIKDSALLLGPFLALTFFFNPNISGKRFAFSQKTITKVALFSLGISLTFGPYLIRNLLTFGDPFPGGQRGLQNVVLGSHPNLIFGSISNYGYAYRDDKEVPAMQADKKYFWQQLKIRIKEHPADYLQWYLLGKTLTGFQWDVVTGHRDVYVYPMDRFGFHSNTFLLTVHQAMQKLHWPLLWLSFLGACLLLKGWLTKSLNEKDMIFIPVLLLFCYFILQLIVFVPAPRYTVPLRPFIYMQAVWMLQFLVVRTKYFRSKRLS